MSVPATQLSPLPTPLIDTFGRVHDNLRISVTDRCNIRCSYCMPETGVPFMPRAEILTYEEIVRFVRVSVSLGVTKLRITGGEPLVRRDLPYLVRELRGIPGLKEMALTTNGVSLKEQAAELHAAGLQRLNVHLDTLDRERFVQITRRDELNRVLEGLACAKDLGFAPIKINAVALKGLTEPDIVPLALFGREHGFEVRFIEFMPLDGQHLWGLDKVLTMSEIIDVIEREVEPLEAIPDADPRAPALEYRYRDGGGRIGFIASVSKPFCLNCNRIRLTSDGKLRYCLFAIEETDVKELLRSGAADREVAAIIAATVKRKWLGHEIASAGFVAPPRPMYSIGG